MNSPDPTPQEGEIPEEEISCLVRRAQARDTEAFGKVFQLLEAKLHRQAFFLAGSEEQALDLLQETMLEVWKHLSRYDGRARFFTWICSVMAHRHYDWVRRWRLRARTLLAQRENAGAEERGASPAEAAVDFERAKQIKACLDALPSKQRTVMYLRFYAGESMEGIAAIVNCSVGTVKSRLFHGLERLAGMRRVQELRAEEQTERWQ
jgi:RNA polymerase sigma-70 factor, ECF subfamily